MYQLSWNELFEKVGVVVNRFTCFTTAKVFFLKLPHFLDIVFSFIHCSNGPFKVFLLRDLPLANEAVLHCS